MWQKILNNKFSRYGLGLGLAVLAGLLIMKTKANKEEQVIPEITLEPTKQMVTELPLPMSEVEKQAIEDKFLSEGVEMTLLKGVGGNQAVGTAWRHFDETEFSHKVEASSLVSPEKGFFYEGWLVGKEGFFSTGRMSVVDGKGKLYYTTDEDKGDFTGVVITLEEEDGNEEPGKHVLEGSF